MRAPEMTRVTKGRPQSTENAWSSGPQVVLQEERHRWIPQVFPVVESPVDFYHSRVLKKDRKRTMVVELLADAEFRQNEKKYQQIMAEKAAIGAGKKNNKFRK
ncbi:unnamed protein product [Oncorhynchus mykiss]|uniref:Fcf2 pre-rRNA processing C-terminal domain-containing protein n=1 Tax=Oncorhynchus mykiss TaxID=8022 RepID=A0A060W574_ONCMY|nr:unnamed protein product [Oncorhynchus mykiss]